MGDSSANERSLKNYKINYGGGGGKWRDLKEDLDLNKTRTLKIVENLNSRIWKRSCLNPHFPGPVEISTILITPPYPAVDPRPGTCSMKHPSRHRSDSSLCINTITVQKVYAAW